MDSYIDYMYIFKLWLIGNLGWMIFVTFYIIYNVTKSRKIFLNQSEEIKERFKPFYRNDV